MTPSSVLSTIRSRVPWSTSVRPSPMVITQEYEARTCDLSNGANHTPGGTMDDRGVR